MTDDWRKDDLTAMVKQINRQSAALLLFAISVPAVMHWLLRDRVSLDTMLVCTFVAVSAALIVAAISDLRIDALRREMRNLPPL